MLLELALTTGINHYIALYNLICHNKDTQWTNLNT